uniref:preprotein translocase subunit SecA n=1 Tax=Gephyrocapsa oceanica TaxID=38817 RepID=UPI002027E720|nr:preprotein translocase subunit SecA [Gephyrocapsa oceanica]UPY84210.1 preprotein translocase subunit SecA [Gephyrocapsa oceanica]
MLEPFFKNYFNQSLTKYNSQVDAINNFGPMLSNLSDDEIRQRVQILKQQLLSNKNEADIICEVFAIVREATFRTLDIKHFDVQLIGGLVLNDGQIAEMKTGEGKTIVALLPTFLNALYGKGVHVVTVNDYLARRDAETVGRVHRFLGLTVGLIQEDMSPEERKQNYQCDVVYVTNNELGFDYLRDNMAFTQEEVVQRPLFYCVVDEVDSILIDEARTPLIISGPSEAPTQKYLQTSQLARVLQKNIHYIIDEKNQVVKLTDEGTLFCEQALKIADLYSPSDPWISYVLNSIKAKELFIRNTHYIVNVEEEVIIVDEFTGRTMAGRRWSDGLHQAIESKENLPIQDESQTLASITYQNLFLLYDKLSGMTGTAKTEELEFEKIYGLKVIPIPTHRDVKRKDFPDLVYKNQYLKWQAIANECIKMNEIDRPVLIGTTTIEKSELLAALLSEYNVPYRLLNARPENIESEAEIVSQAGCRGAITISTNMAGRGTDIALGGNLESLLKVKLKKFISDLVSADFSTVLKSAQFDEFLVSFVPVFETFGLSKLNESSVREDLLEYLNEGIIPDRSDITDFITAYNSFLKERAAILLEEKTLITKLGGLHVIGTERHESRRIDNQLRGRSGRQGDPGSSRFFLSLDDKLLRLFGGDQILNLLQNIGLEDDAPIQSPILTKSLESAQKKVEVYYFDSRKQLFEYDQALTMQRNGIYSERKRVLEKESLRDWIIEYGERSLYDITLAFSTNTNLALDKFFALKTQELLGMPYQVKWESAKGDIHVLLNNLKHQFQVSYTLKEAQLEAIEPGIMRELERSFLLQQIDFSWKEHLQKISALRDSIRWRSYGQRDPLTDYKKESYSTFVTMLNRIRHQVIYFIFRSKITIDFE